MAVLVDVAVATAVEVDDVEEVRSLLVLMRGKKQQNYCPSEVLLYYLKSPWPGAGEDGFDP